MSILYGCDEQSLASCRVLYTTTNVDRMRRKRNQFNNGELDGLKVITKKWKRDDQQLIDINGAA